LGSDVRKLASAIRLAVSLGATAFAAAPRPSFGQTASDAERPPGPTLETIVVTGSNIRRVDTETANPIITIDKATIERSGKVTLGDLVQDLPAVSGPYTNPRVNNGGGTGASTVSLRGLGSQRTLVLVNGHRYLYGDVNAIPAAAVERIEVLTDGASAVYGSDAVAGVVNFILRSNYQGAEFAVNYGISDRDDGARQGYHFVFGQTSDKGGLLAGVDYNKYDLVLASNRAFSTNALYYYYGTAHLSGGSTRTPGGRVQLPKNLKAQFGCSFVTLNAVGQISSPPALGDFRCYDSAIDNYNFQAHGNVELTPQERSSAFVAGHYKLTDTVETYLEYFHNKTQSAFQIAPLPVDTEGSLLVISAQSYYNPFGVDFSKDANSFRTRTIGNGNRIGNFSTQADQATAGFRGSISGTSWQWNAYVNYGHFTQLNHTSGFVNLAKLNPFTGPSYLDASGHVVCGTDPATGGSGPIANCTPLNLFDVTNPQTIAALNNASGNTFINVFYQERSAVAEASGGVWDLPGGTAQLAVGASYRKEYGQTEPDAPLVPDEFGVCDIGTGCIAPIGGAYNVREAYAELLVPLLKDLPFATALNLTIGDRYSRYSNFGSTNNPKYALEYRPTEDLLLRGTVSSVFRAPTISDLFQGVSQGGGGAGVDPCFGLVGTNAACVGVPGDGSFAGIPSDEPPHRPVQGGQLFAGAVTADSPIGPEQGRTFDWGFVYDPQWLPGLSWSVDLWRIYLTNEIGWIFTQQVLDLCYLSNGGPYCHLIHRYGHGELQGQIQFVTAVRGNIGRVDVKGADTALHYRLPATAFGKFALSFDATYLDRYSDDVTPGLPGDIVQEYAGHYTNYASAIQGANFSRWKALATLNWNLGAWSAAWTMHYYGKYTVGYAREDYQASACASSLPPGCELHYGASVYHNVTVGYNIEPLNTRIDVGIDNLSDKQPAILYQNNTFNGNVDANTFDTIGRFYWARVTVKF
jgi:outer membrane receptor protein involved in Fe transport